MIWADVAAVLIRRARKLYVKDEVAVDLANTVYALDSTTIDLCLSLFPWADFGSTKAAVKMHALLDLRGSIPSFIHVSNGKMHDASALDLIVPEPGAIYFMDRGYLDFGRLHALHQVGSFFVTRAKSNMDFHRVYSHDVDKLTGVIADQSIMLDGFYALQTIHIICAAFVSTILPVCFGNVLIHIHRAAATRAVAYGQRWDDVLLVEPSGWHLRCSLLAVNNEIANNWGCTYNS
jgi:hypothetical protein